MSRSVAFAGLLVGMFTFACGSSPDPETPGPMGPIDGGLAPRYSELFDTYFAPGTSGHCASAGCHADPGHTVWRCGPSKDDCYDGMVTVGLIEPAQPSHSAIVDVHRSPLVWINPAGGNMPLDAQLANAAGREAIIAWVAAGALND
ncbi:MAG: hypothetical protein ABIQ16_12970 [Polyangiaceae bacterium]